MAKLKERDPVIDADDMDPADEEHSYDIMSEETIKEIVGARRSDYFFDAAKDYALPPQSERTVEEKTISNLRKMSTACREGLMTGSLIPYLCDWCDTPKKPSSGVSFEDVSIRFQGSRNSRQIRKSPENDIYLSIGMKFFSPFPPADVARLQK